MIAYNLVRESDFNLLLATRPPGDNPIAVNKYYYIMPNSLCVRTVIQKHVRLIWLVQTIDVSYCDGKEYMLLPDNSKLKCGGHKNAMW